MRALSTSNYLREPIALEFESAWIALGPMKKKTIELSNTSTSSVQLHWLIGLPLWCSELCELCVGALRIRFNHLEYGCYIFVLSLFQTVDGKYFASETRRCFNTARADFFFKVPSPRRGPPTPPIAMLFFGGSSLAKYFPLHATSFFKVEALLQHCDRGCGGVPQLQLEKRVPVFTCEILSVNSSCVVYHWFVSAS